MRRAPVNTEPISFEEYLRLEDLAAVRHEFVNGLMYEMGDENEEELQARVASSTTGATDNHNQIAINILTQARLKARASACRAYASDMKIRTPDGTGYHPDVFMTCNEPNDGSRVKHNPCFIVEVLSPSTEAFDRGEKFLRYLQIPSLKAYILVSQDRKLVEVYRRMPDDSQPENTWRYEKIQDNGRLELPCVNLTVTLEDVYEDVEFQTSIQQNSIE